jgi:perosamine synthetase
MHIYLTKASIFRKDLESVLETMLTDKFGPARYRHVREFEKELNQTLSGSGCVVVNSGSAALHLAFLAYGIQAGDEIIIPSFAEPSILHVCGYTGAKPVIVDINHNNFGISFEAVKNAVSPRTKLLYIPHLFGFPVDVSVFKELNVPILEDVTQSLGAEFKGKKTGMDGLMTVCSFTDEKMITTGQGGALLSSDRAIIARARELTDYQDPDPEKFGPRYNYRLSDLLAALGLTQLRYLPRYVEKRQQVAEEYSRLFVKAGLQPFELSVDRYNTCFKYVLTLQGKVQKTIHHLKKVHIEAEEPVHTPLHRLLKLDTAAFPNSERAWFTSLSIPIYPTLKKNEIERVASEVIRSVQE